jgi:hypothetical protein
MENLERHFTFKEIGVLTGTSADWARRAWKAGDFGTQYIDISASCSGREIRIPESAVRAYLARRTFNLPAVVETQIAVAR